MSESTSEPRRVAMLAPMRPELKAIVRAGALSKLPEGGPFSHGGDIGGWTVSAGLIGIRPSLAGPATERMLAHGAFDHVMVVGIAGGLDPELAIGSLLVPSQVKLYPDGAVYQSHPLAGRTATGALMTTDGLFSDDAVWGPILQGGFGAVDMEAAAVAEICERAGVAWSVYRGISDRPDEHIVDQAVFELSKPDGSANVAAVAKYLARDPRRAKALAHLNRCMELAANVAAEAAFADLART